MICFEKYLTLLHLAIPSRLKFNTYLRWNSALRSKTHLWTSQDDISETHGWVEFIYNISMIPETEERISSRSGVINNEIKWLWWASVQRRHPRKLTELRQLLGRQRKGWGSLPRSQMLLSKAGKMNCSLVSVSCD